MRRKTTTIKESPGKGKKFFYLDDEQEVYLTKREAQCFSWIVRGMTAKATGNKMRIKPRTVAKYVLILKEKLGCYSKDELIEKAIKDDMTTVILSWANEK